MRIVLAAAALIPLAGCNEIYRAQAVDACADFYHYTQDTEVGDERMKTVCGCAVDREQAGLTPSVTMPDASNPGLPAYRRHIPDCLATNGGSAYGIAARESAGPRPQPAIFDPATGRTTAAPPPPPGPPGTGGEPPPPEEPAPTSEPGAKPPPVVQEFNPNRIIDEANRAIEDAQRDMENAARAVEDAGKR